MPAVSDLSLAIGTARACDALGLARASYYRDLQPQPPARERPIPARALSAVERQVVLDTLHCETFVDKAPAEVWATLLDQGTYLCSPRTMYRILVDEQEVLNAVAQVNKEVSPPTRSPNSSPRHPTRSGAGTSRSCSARPSGRTSTST